MVSRSLILCILISRDLFIFLVSSFAELIRCETLQKRRCYWINTIPHKSVSKLGRRSHNTVYHTRSSWHRQGLLNFQWFWRTNSEKTFRYFYLQWDLLQVKRQLGKEKYLPYDRCLVYVTVRQTPGTSLMPETKFTSLKGEMDTQICKSFEATLGITNHIYIQSTKS